MKPGALEVCPSASAHHFGEERREGTRTNMHYVGYFREHHSQIRLAGGFPREDEKVIDTAGGMGKQGIHSRPIAE